MELRQLAYFAAVADEGGFARAAERLHIGQPAVSQQVRRLERELGVVLFDRSTRHVRLTGAGERLLAEARQVLEAVERTRRVAAELASAASGVLHLGTGFAHDERVYSLLGLLADRAPDLRVRLTKSPLARRLSGVRTGALDAAFVRDLWDGPGIELFPAWSDPLVAALPAGHPLAARDVLDLADLGDLPVRLGPRRGNPPFHALVTGAFRAAGIAPPAGPPFTRLQETLADMVHAPPSWTVFYPVGPPPPMPGIAYRELTAPRSTTLVAVRPDPPEDPVRHLLAALRSMSASAEGLPGRVGVLGGGTRAGAGAGAAFDPVPRSASR
ncbi:LysR family transcriptional regulator [Nocardiopsis sp. NPDC050513]|uniref:LysR family transcriptional regulator n=1 Tax=Nocardiopsis sp. NPDC050513 TaxID=3364338 RepID=UPI0037A82C05